MSPCDQGGTTDELYNEHLAQYLADDRFRYTQYEAQSLGLAKARRAKGKASFPYAGSLRSWLGSL